MHLKYDYVNVESKLQALVYDILPWRRVPESDARSVCRVLSIETVGMKLNFFLREIESEKQTDRMGTGKRGRGVSDGRIQRHQLML